MMLIYLEDLRPKIESLIPILQAAQEEVNRETDLEERRKLIDRIRTRIQDEWMAIRAAMGELSNNKCWYTECQAQGCEDDIDHYRPKKRVDEDDSHPGYYWLAFTWRNLRLSCQRANRPRRGPATNVTGGKSDRFPLLLGSTRARTPTDNLGLELPLLLDPTKPRDVDVVTFQSNGLVAINPELESDPTEVARFEASRECYHLDWFMIRDARTTLYNQIVRWVERGQQCAPPQDSPTLVSSTEFDSVVGDLRRMMDRKQPYSSAATAYIKAHRHIWWVERHVLQLSTARATQG